MAAAAVATSAATRRGLSSSAKASSNIGAVTTASTVADGSGEEVANRKASKTDSTMASGEPGQASGDDGLCSEQAAGDLPVQPPARAEAKKAKEKLVKKLAKRKPSKQSSKKASKNQLKQQQQQENKAPSFVSSDGQQQATKPRLLVEELKLFQNNHLLNQQDPIQRLQQQLNGLIEGDDDVIISNRAHHQNLRSSKSFQQAKPNAMTNGFAANIPLPTSSSSALQHGQQSSAQLSFAEMRNSIIFPYNTEENTFTVKKGVLWQQQIYEKFHQRLFSRWKKRYFILTTDYFVCFKRSSSKVGCSEMGKFLYKTALSDVAKISWSKPTKSDKGAIILCINGQFSLSIWSKDSLDEWMFVINESVERNKIRRSCALQNNANKVVANDIKPLLDGCDLYENTALVSNFGVIGQKGKQERIGANDGSNLVNEATIENSNDSVPVPVEHDNNRSQTITKCTKSEPLGAITKLRSPHRISTDEADYIEEPKPSLDIDSPLDHKKEGNGVKSSSLSDSSTNSCSGSRRAHLIEHERQVEDHHKTSTEAKKADDVRVSRRGRKPIINHSAAKNDDRAIEGNYDNGSNEGLPTDDGKKPGDSSAEPNQTTNDSSSELSKRPAGTNGSSSSLKIVEGDSLSGDSDQHHRDDNNCRGSSNSPGASLTDANQSNLVKSDSRRSNRYKLPTKDSKQSAEGKTCNSDGSKSNRSNIKQNESGETEQLNPVACDIGESSMNYKGSQPMKIANLGEPTEIKAVMLLQRPPSNLIRRDDSWQSLVSLTRVGKVPPVSVQVAQRSLYAQHIMPDTNNGFRDSHQPQHSSGREEHMTNIESTATPSRCPFLRQQSIQVPSRKLGPVLPPRQQATSFDVAPSSPMLTNQQQQQMQFQQQLQQNTSSYQQRLLQLQLLQSNSNNVDYIRHNSDSANDYQIYWPESTAYGYSSMRSNLKSAASEFSFIRPSPSSHGQSTLPHQSHLSGRLLDNQSTQQQKQAIRTSLNFSNKASNVIQQSDSNNNDIECLSPLSKQLAHQQQQQFLVNPMTGERLINQQALLGGAKDLMVSELAPPMRELPLKPNKKRTLANETSSANGSSLPKSSSLTSSIACFFRRAFSRRSKKKHCSKLAESCSSSLGAFEDGYSNVPIVPSAFSTGSKSVGGRKKMYNSSGNSENANNLVQSQRMVDMIEAFTNKTLAAAEQANTGSDSSRFDLISKRQSDQQQQRLQSPSMDLNATPKVSSQIKNQHHLKSVLNQFGSPLHKSNSISATMGLSLADANSRRTYLYDNDFAPGGGACRGSPMLMRSAKVMSANLTPLMSRREAPALGVVEQQQFFISPRNSRPDQLPRPSSIYGQPSMISSPITTRDERNNFGVHRNSLHNHNFRDRNHSQGIEIRRHQMMKVPFLDTTREVAEEISSPTTDSKEHDYEQEAYQARRNQTEQSAYGHYPLEKLNMISASPSSGRLKQKHPQAIVNPILQSPTMDTIYDNHPMLNGAEMNPSYSHYDNHNHLLMERHRQSPSLNQAQSVQYYMSAETQPISPLIIASESPYSSYQINTTQSHTPSHQRFSDTERLSAMDIMLINKKPSAIVAPSTPSRNENFGNDLNSMNSSPIIDRYRNQPQFNSQSPMQSRRIVNSQPQYQQSPLVSSQTRVLSKGDRIQATFIGDPGLGSGGRLVQPVVNIAGAPGINLEPSLAASLIRGTNIDAYESSTFDRLNSSPSQSNSKTFLVSTRLSKSMAYSQSSPSNNDKNSISSSVVCNESIVTARSSKDELSSSGSRSMNFSIGRGSLRRKGKNLGTSSSQEDQQDESSGSDTHGNRRNNTSVNNENYLLKKVPSSYEPSRHKFEKSTGELS